MEGDKVEELSRIKESSEVSEAMKVFERYLLTKVLGWKLAYSAPHDFLQLLKPWLVRTGRIPGPEADGVLERAKNLVHLLLLCMSFGL